MDFNVKGITFNKDDLTTINLSEIKTETISRSHLFHLLPGGRRAILLLRAGDFVEPEFITKYLDKGMQSLYQLEIISNDDLQFYKEKWSLLKNAKTQSDQFALRDEIISQIAKDFWSSKEKSFLSFVISCFEEFYSFPPHILNKFQDLSMLLYTRSLLVSSVSCIASLANGYVDYKFIKDFYNTSFIMDYGLIEFGGFNFMMSMACESERNKPGSGTEFLTKNNRSKSEIQTFIHHPNVSYRAASEYTKDFSYPEILANVKLHHEKCDGSGFPNGYSYSGMSATETLLSFCDYLIPYKEHLFLKGDGHCILKEYFESLKELENHNKLPIKKIIVTWEGIMNWAIKETNEVAS